MPGVLSATPVAPDPLTYAFQWHSQLVTKKDTKDGPLVRLPEYYRLVKDDSERAQWVAAVIVNTAGS